MKKNLSILFVIVLTLSLLLSACGGSADTNSIVGTWQNPDDGGTLSFAEDGSAMVNVGGEQIPSTYEFDGSSLTITSSTGEITFTVTFEGDTMTLTGENGTYSVYTKQ